MSRTPKPAEWMKNKYGSLVQPFEFSTIVPNIVSGDCG